MKTPFFRKRLLMPCTTFRSVKGSVAIRLDLSHVWENFLHNGKLGLFGDFRSSGGFTKVLGLHPEPLSQSVKIVQNEFFAVGFCNGQKPFKNAMHEQVLICLLLYRFRAIKRQNFIDGASTR